jgi:hypothetical protein
LIDAGQIARSRRPADRSRVEDDEPGSATLTRDDVRVLVVAVGDPAPVRGDSRVPSFGEDASRRTIDVPDQERVLLRLTAEGVLDRPNQRGTCRRARHSTRARARPRHSCEEDHAPAWRDDSDRRSHLQLTCTSVSAAQLRRQSDRLAQATFPHTVPSRATSLSGASVTFPISRHGRRRGRKWRDGADCNRGN